jgi:hypothetical protein
VLLTGGGIRELSVTGLTSNPTIFDQAIKHNKDYDAAIRQKSQGAKAITASPPPPRSQPRGTRPHDPPHALPG